MDFTEKQNKAIKNRGNILVSAAAGSGKTRVLTERICRIIRNGEAEVDDLLVLTFTKSAAAEMKKRIYDSLMAISDSERLGVMAEKVSSADITTIDSFCQRVVRDKYHVLGLSPSFKITDEKVNTRLLKKTLAEILEEQTTAGDENLARLYLKYGKRSGQALSDMIIAIYRSLMVMPEPEAFEAEIQKNYLNPDYLEQILFNLQAESLAALNMAKEILVQLLALAKSSDFPKAEALLSGYLASLAKMIRLFESGDEAARTVKVFEATFRIDAMPEDIKHVFTAGKANAAEKIADVLKGPTLSEWRTLLYAELTTMISDSRTLLGLALTLRMRFSEAKLQKNVLDFNDLEHYAYEILKDPEHAKDFSYQYIFLDEYQDTNPLQEAIIEKIKGAHNLFMVGDVKQSIYAFRHADSDIFLDKQNRFAEFDDKPFDDDELIRMNENFRSSTAVIGAVNHVMGELLTPEFGGIDYQNKEALVHSAALSDGSAELLLIDSKADFFPPEFNGDALTATEAEAFAIANQIIEIKGQPFFSREAGKEKSLDFSDMVVLLRELKNSGPVYKRVFESCGIPVDISFSSGSVAVPETEQFSAILKCVLNPTDDVACVSAMRYGYFDISSSDIARIRIAAADKSTAFYASAMEYAKNADDNLARKINRFFLTLDHLKERAMTLSGEAFLSYVYHHLQFEEILAASPRKSLKAEALKAYIRALLAEAPGSAHLARMVLMLDEMKQNGDTLDANSTHTNPNSVRVMTVHKSKGLEFPVVFVAGLDKRFNSDNKTDFVLDKSLGLGFKILEPQKNFKRDGVVYQSLIKKQRLDSLFEEIRVLYVAMTRAENRLFLVGGVAGLKNSLDSWLTSGKSAMRFAGSYIDLIAPAVLNKAGFAEGFAIGRYLPPNLSASPEIPIRILPKRGYAYTGGADRAAILSDFLAQVPKPVPVGYVYPYAETLNIPSKRSVSSLKPRDTKVLPRKQVAFTALDASNLTPAERGTAFHVYMQHADFNHTTAAEVKRDIDALVSEQVLSPDEATALSVEQILSVLNSEIIVRAKRSPLVYREKNFSLKMDSGALGLSAGETVVVQGTIDLCFIEEGAFVLVDYKTDQVSSNALEARVDSYRSQIEAYAQALTDLTGYPVSEKYLFFIHQGCVRA